MPEFLQKYLNDNKIDRETASDILNIYKEYVFKYQYLKLSSQSWNNIFIDALSQNLNPEFNETELIFTLDRIINHFIITNIKNLNLKFINNYLAYLRNRGNKYALKTLLNLLRYPSIDTKEYFKQLKVESIVLKNILEELTIQSFGYDQIVKFCNGKYDIEFSLKPPTRTLSWTIQTLEYIQRLSAKPFNLHQEDFKLTPEYRKLKYLLVYYDMFDSIKDMYKKYINPNINSTCLDKALFSMTYEELEELILKYKNYKLFEVINQDKTFLVQLGKYLFQTNVIVSNEEEPESPTPVLTKKK